MSVREIIEWMAFDLSSDSEFKEKVALEKQKQQTADEQFAAFRAVLG